MMSQFSGSEQAAQCARCEATTLDEVCSSLRDFGDANIRAIQAAFARAEIGVYGYCEDCHRAIDVERLNASEVATRCSACERVRAKVVGGAA
jgi:RNA polymerase-binding transcription factor DksA